MSSRLRIPVATYRLQFNKDFRFKDARSLVSYLSQLGISDIYASPILKARKGSIHGYDVTDPTILNPELGTEHDFDALVEKLWQQGMGLLLDIVPNHMAASPENPWWQDVLEYGDDSPFAGFFDTAWLNFGGSNHESTGYRRFFDISDFVGVRVEDPEVFETTHAYIFQLVAEGKVTGLRIDHIDGLYDPLEYLLRLQQQTTQQEKKGLGFYVLVEKILSGDETIPEEWPVFGTTGYDFAKILNALFVNSGSIKSLKEIYARATSLGKSFSDLVYEKKRQVMLELFPSEIEALGQWLAYLSGQVARQEASIALIEVTACLPVYRTYINSTEITSHDLRYLETAMQEAVSRSAAPEVVLRFLKRVLLQEFTADVTQEQKNEWLNFVRHWQQLTGAVMAKGFEDTALYNFHRLVSLNEVGGEPDSSGLSIEEFHDWNQARATYWPHTLNATSTHDTKRSEDIRARINVLSEIPVEWQKHLSRWQEWNHEKKASPDELPVPEPNTEILLYQTLIGAWPLHQREVPEFKERLKAYMIKATREAKAITSWLKINQKYEDSVLSFVDSILEKSADNKFLQDFLEFQANIAYYGALNSISQVLLKITSPGVPDFYQGMELWDFSLVDPDNRRPVDFSKRKRLLASLIQKEANGEPPPIDEMLASWNDGRIKLYVTYKALNTRQDYLELFQKGDYIPLRVEGKRREHVCAFAWRYEDKWALVAVPRFFTQLSEAGVLPIGKQVWQENHILLPEDTLLNWLNVFTGETISVGKGIALAELFHKFPVAMLVGR
ncbi:malto-oligosyltrehalose synthase [Chloroflexota bacterium]